MCSCHSLADLAPARLHRLILSGVPTAHRAHVWGHCAARGHGAALSPPPYAALLARVEAAERGDGDQAADEMMSRHARVVDADLLRTFPAHPHFAGGSDAQRDTEGEGGGLLAPLRRVLLVHALHASAVGYCQGLNFLAALLLLHADEARAFALLSALSGHLLAGFHAAGMGGLLEAQEAMMGALGVLQPRVLSHMDDRDVPIEQLSTRWFLAAFADSAPLQLTLRLWDLLFLEGSTVLIGATVALVGINAEQLLADDGHVQDGLNAIFHCEPDAVLRALADRRLGEQISAALRATRDRT